MPLFITGVIDRFQPTSVTSATLQAWYNDKNHVASGANVTGWNDASANGLDLLASRLPANDGGVVISAGLNGYDTVRFNGSTDGLQSATFTPITQPLHVFLVINQITWVSVARILDMNTTNTSLLYQRLSTPEIAHWAGADANKVSATTGSWFLVESLFDGASSKQRLNDAVAVSGDNPGVGVPNEFTIGCASGGNSFSNIEVADLAVYDGEVTGSDLTSLRDSYYNGKFSLW